MVFPHTDTILSFGRPKSTSAVNAAFQEDRVIAIFTQKDLRTLDPKEEDLHKVGTIATISQMMSTNEGEIHAVIKGHARISLEEIIGEEPYLVGKVEEIAEEETSGDAVEALNRQLAAVFRRSVNLGKSVEITTVMRMVSGKVEPVELVDSVAALLEVKTGEKQRLLETLSVRERLQKVIELLTHEVNVLELEKTISDKTHKKFEEQMRRAMLKEKRKTIDAELEELGDEDGTGEDDIADYKKKILKAKMPKEVDTKAKKELKRLSQMSMNNPETAYIRNYLDWLVDMPWSVTTPNDISIKKAAKVLEDDHYGLEKVKERILEYLAVIKAKKSYKDKTKASHPTILCFMGPPGVGKTSLGKSIAKATGRKFVRVSLGGIRDEAEIRGHRRTYVGALPGRIVQGIKNAGSKNPVFMLDEIDKIGIDFRGDPSSALLEALDPEQNKEFSDHYLEVPFDLSDVMFIATGNVLENIPSPLRDRMEIIPFAGYTEDEKLHIAQKYLWPKQLEVNGLLNDKVKIQAEALNEVIRRHTREAGVRELERNLAKVARKVVRMKAEDKKYPKVVKKTDIRTLLGPQKFSSQIAEKKDEVGMSTGLAVTSAGGEILFIEVAFMPGRGRLILTGQLGDVMKESARAAFTWAKAHWRDLGIPEDFAVGRDVHVHVPEGATPKDGPSAGIALATALVSAMTGIPVKRFVGMTGEVTLRGRVLEIGGVKEKVIAGHRAGLKTIILPKDNEKDMEDVPAIVKKEVKFHFASRLDEVLVLAMKSWPLTVNKLKRTPSKQAPFLPLA